MASTISLKGTTAKVTAIAVIIGLLVFMWFAIRWQIGNMFAEVTSPNDPGADVIADAAISLAPSDPGAYWLGGNVKRGFFDPESIDASVSYFRRGAVVAPFNYRAWTELGRANEHAGNIDAAASAFGRAVELAPEYAIPRWQYGNFLLRQGRMEDAARELRLAAEYNTPYREQVFGIAWNVLGNDPRVVDQFVSNKPDVKISLASFYANRGRPDDAINAWNEVPEDLKIRYRYVAERIGRELFDKKMFRGALEFYRQAGIDSAGRAEAVTNGGFETQVGLAEHVPGFDWGIYRTDGKVEVVRDLRTRRSGASSIRFTFRGYTNPQLNNLQQGVVISPAGRYRLTFWVRTEDLKSASMPFIEILNGDASLAAVTPPLPTGTNDWQPISVEFKVSDTSEAFFIRTSREPCSGECPLVGVFWLDDFELTRL